MRPAIEARRIAGQRVAYARQDDLRRRVRTVVGKTAATFTTPPTSDAPRVVLERDISPTAWQLLTVAGAAVSGEILYHDGSEWAILAAGDEGDVLKMASGKPKWLAP